MTYVSRLEEGVKDYSKTEIKFGELSSDVVFHGICPRLTTASAVGYRGDCMVNPPDPVDVSEALWSLLGRLVEILLKSSFL